MPTEEAQKKLLLPGFAIYASPENLSKHADIVIPEDSVSYSSEATQLKLPLMTKLVAPIVMSGDDYPEKWIVEPWHIRVALRTYSGIHLESDECVRIPSDKKVEGPRSRYSITLSFLYKMGPFKSLNSSKRVIVLTLIL